ncbi:MAG TPA: GNAT family N-acetyltransferase [Acidimicrobiales bacterium]|nr:GNAT family N-acetyltransferase [Acidimicrobiales bacterium]
MNRGCPNEAARRGTPTDRADIDALRVEARAATREVRGGAALWGRDRPASVTEPVLAAALAGAADSCVLLGTLDGMGAGYLLARALDTDGSGRVAEVVELWVTPQARGIGVGEALMEELIDWANELDCGEVDALALPGDRDTKNFFESHGLVARAISVSRRLHRDDQG